MSSNVDASIVAVHADFNLFKSERFNKSLAVAEEEEFKKKSGGRKNGGVLRRHFGRATCSLNSRVYDILSCARARARRRTLFLMRFVYCQ